MSLRRRTRALRTRVLVGIACGFACGGQAPGDVRGAYEAGLAFFARDVRGVDPGWANLFGYLHRRFGLEATSADGRTLEQVPDDGARPEMAAIFRRLVNAQATVAPGQIAALESQIDRMTASALHCDRIPLPDEWTAVLRAATQAGGYALTHAALAGQWSLESGCGSAAEIRVLQREQAQALAGLVEARDTLPDRFATPTDLWIEALAMLYYLQAGDRVREDWLRDLLAAQQRDGGWPARAGAPSDAHATALALWVLLEQLQPDAPPIAWVPSADAPPESLPGWEEMVAVEELILALRPRLRALERSLRNLELPDPPALTHFDAAVQARDLAAGDPRDALPTGPAYAARSAALPLGEDAPPLAATELTLLAPLLAVLSHVERAELGVADAHFAGPERKQLAMRLALRVRAVDAAGAPLAVRGAIDVRWTRRGGDARDPESWRIDRWHTQSLELASAPRPLFREVLAAALPDAEARARVRTSRHERLAAEKLLDPDGFRRPHRHFFQGSQDRHPGVAVTDLNGDGFDDLFVMPRWGANQLLLSSGDGRFEERSREWGLDLADHSAAAIFADFDNDGDADLFLGRTLARSVYLENLGGRFEDRSEHAFTGFAAPALVSSVSAADVDGDGLLDLYVSTYAAQMLSTELLEWSRARDAGLAPTPHLLPDFLPAGDAKRLFDLTQERGAHIFLSLPGPPNMLLRNEGSGRFARDDTAGPLKSFRNTYQATWSDYDADGDPDVYLAHDFAKNQLLRNEGGGRFRDVTEETGTADIGFGMGVSWGDYDNDGRQDLYVSNMYSKAGKRITSRVAGLSDALPKMARGNTLFRNEGERFTVVSGEGNGTLAVEAAGWAWGGQFGDVDNDGFLDLFVPAGYYTAPPEAAVDVDI